MVGLGIGVTVIEILLNGNFEVVYAPKHTATDPLLGNVPEKALYQIDPRGRGRREMHVKSRVLSHPVFDIGMLVCRIVIDDQIHIQALVGFPMEFLEKLEKFVMAMPGLTLANDRSRLQGQTAVLRKPKEVVPSDPKPSTANYRALASTSAAHWLRLLP